mgnify:FL=1
MIALLRNLYNYIYIRLTGKCSYDGTFLYDPSTNPKLVLRECEKCGKVWFLERKEK